MAIFVADRATNMAWLPELGIANSHDSSRTAVVEGSNPDVQLTLTQGAISLVVRGDIRFDVLIAVFDVNGSIYGPVNYLRVDSHGEEAYTLSNFHIESRDLHNYIADNHTYAAMRTILAGGDKIEGSGFDDTLLGFDGNDGISGNGGADTIDGMGGADVMSGGAGNDTYIVDNAGDVVDELGDKVGIDSVRSSVDFSLTDGTHALGDVENLYLTGTRNIDGTGNALNNIVSGNNGANTIRGGGGSDYLDGQEGDDDIKGGGAGDAIRGGGGNDTIDGGAGDDSLVGLARNDKLAGGAGNDSMAGGAGKDRFIFDAALNAAANVDHIADFSHLNDRFVLDHAVFTAIAAGRLGSGAFHLGVHAGDGSDRIVYDHGTGRLYFDPDGTGARPQVLFAVLDNHATLSSDDFVIG
jgi:Ca2+-binding RTX toxin-like protein